MSDLLSCPFCGGTAKNHAIYGSVCCINLSCPILMKPVAIKAWNTRAIPTYIGFDLAIDYKQAAMKSG